MSRVATESVVERATLLSAFLDQARVSAAEN